MSAELQASRRDATLILTLSNPGAGNMLHPDMYAAAIETLSTAERDDTIRAVVLTGADDVFCAGGDLHRLLESRAKPDHAEAIDTLQGWIESIRACPKPVIAAVEGKAAGAGFSLALACDMIVAGASATFAMNFARIGLTPEGGGSWFLAQGLPRQLASEILIEGKPVAASRLHEVGIVNKLVPDGAALDTALDWAEEFVDVSPNAVESIKSLVQEARQNPLALHFEAEKLHFIENLKHRNAQEGISAFLEKRKPQFK